VAEIAFFGFGTTTICRMARKSSAKRAPWLLLAYRVGRLCPIDPGTRRPEGRANEPPFQQSIWRPIMDPLAGSSRSSLHGGEDMEQMAGCQDWPLAVVESLIIVQRGQSRGISDGPLFAARRLGTLFLPHGTRLGGMETLGWGSRGQARKERLILGAGRPAPGRDVVGKKKGKRKSSAIWRWAGTSGRLLPRAAWVEPVRSRRTVTSCSRLSK